MDCRNNTCQNVFIHKTAEELSAVFTDLWVKVINENERYFSDSRQSLADWCGENE